MRSTRQNLLTPHERADGRLQQERSIPALAVQAQTKPHLEAVFVQSESARSEESWCKLIELLIEIGGSTQ